mmetsp:Transcript_53219/g.106852  ORF Transcript_53219/g.106852 Transcript_53219/m.106852 type:complete len:236 (+) Transcript_53219:281-988(+)
MVPEHGLQLFDVDLAAAVPVEGTEGLPDQLFLQVVLLVDHARQELAVADLAAPVYVQILEDLLQVREVSEAGRLARLLHLRQRQRSIAVLVKLLEGFAKLRNVLVVKAVGDDLQGRLLEAVHRAEGLQLGQDRTGHRRAIAGLDLPLQPLDPRAVQDLARGRPLLGGPLAHRQDELLDLAGYSLKLLQIERDVPLLDRGHDLLVGLSTEWRRARQQDVQDHPDAPDVTLLTVFAG